MNVVNVLNMNRRKIKKALNRLLHLPRGKYFLLYVGNKVKHFYCRFSKSTSVAYPSTVMLELTNLCNLACVTCPREYDYGKVMDKGKMNLADAKNVVDELWPYLDSIGLTGMGETFLYTDIEEIVNYIKNKNKGIVISVSTNAVLPNFIQCVTPVIGKIDTIQVSIDGLDDVYDSIRIKSSFKILDQNLRELLKLATRSGTDVMLNMVVVKENYKHMPKLVQYAAGIGVKYLDFTLFNLASVTKIDQSYYDFYQTDEFNVILHELEAVIKNTPEVLVTERNFKTENNFQKCSFPWSHFYISWNGYVPPCCAKPFPKELNFGNVKDANVMTVLNSAAYKDFRNLWYENKSPKFCEKCHLINIKPIKSNP